ncbi:MAG: helix-turn-helix domain-containing protein, partial [Succinivibrio sp.]
LVNVSSQVTTLDTIKERVAKEYEVSVASMESAERKKATSNARSMAMTLANDLIPNLSLNDLGRSFNKDHSSVHEAIKRTRERISNNQEIAAVYQKLTLSLKKN